MELMSARLLFSIDGASEREEWDLAQGNPSQSVTADSSERASLNQKQRWEVIPSTRRNRTLEGVIIVTKEGALKKAPGPAIATGSARPAGYRRITFTRPEGLSTPLATAPPVPLALSSSLCVGPYGIITQNASVHFFLNIPLVTSQMSIWLEESTSILRLTSALDAQREQGGRIRQYLS